MSLRTVSAIIALVAVLSACGQKAEQKVQATNIEQEGTTKSLADQLTELREAGKSSVPPEVLAVGEAFKQQLAESGMLDKALNVGDKAPSFELTNALGESVKSADILAQGPAVITFYRGYW